LGHKYKGISFWFVSAACERLGIDAAKVDIGIEKAEVLDTFRRISLFGEDRQAVFGNAFSIEPRALGRFLTPREKKFLLPCGRSPARKNMPTSRKRIVVRLIILFPSMKRIHPMRTNSLGLLLFKNCTAFFKHASAQDNLIGLFKA
jgi:hypothetical protein